MANIKFKPGSLFKDNEPQDGVVVVCINGQGITSFSPDLRALEKHLPFTFKRYIKNCIAGMVTPGEVFFEKEQGYDVALIATNEHIIGQWRDKDELVRMDLVEGLNVVVERYGKKNKYVSCILGRPYQMFLTVEGFIRKNDLNWMMIKD